MDDKIAFSLSEAPQDIQLAVDLIFLLESNEVDPQTALDALQIVQHDLQSKIAHTNTTSTPLLNKDS